MIFAPLLSGVVISLVGVVTPGTPQSAAQELLDKLAKAANEKEAASLADQVWDAWMSSGSPTVDILMTRAIAALKAGDAPTARDLLDRAIMIRPQYAEAWNRRATLFFNDGKYDEAIADIESTLKYEPRHFGAWMGLGMIFESIDKPAAALKAYRKALAIDPFLEAAKQGEKRLSVLVDGRPL